MDLRNPKLMYLKAILFVVAGALASSGVLLLAPDIKVALLLLIAIWSFCRAYYFAFYVIEHYIDPGYRFAGLWDFAKYLMGKPASRADQSSLAEKPATLK